MQRPESNGSLRTSQISRIRTIDWLRGLSVVVMIVAHSLAFLSPAHDHDRARFYFDQLNGLPGPAFIFVAGFSLALVTARGGDDPAKRWARAWRSLARIGQVFVGSLVVRVTMWDSLHHVGRFRWIDVLSCIGLMMLMTWFVLFALPAWRWLRFSALTTMTIVVFVAAPWVEAPRTFGWATTLLNNGPYADTWPLVPWVGYGWLGAIVGLLVGRSRSPLRMLGIAFGAIVIVGLIITLLGPLIVSIEPTINPWMITNAGDRLWRIAIIGLVLLACEARGLTFERGLIQPFGLLVRTFSRQSLVAYVTHLILLFGWIWFRPLNRWLYLSDWPTYIVLAIVVLLWTALVCVVADAWSRWKVARTMETREKTT